MEIIKETNYATKVVHISSQKTKSIKQVD